MSKLILRKQLFLRLGETAMVLLLLLSSFSLHAATGPKINVSGTVTSESDSEPLIGVSVLVKGTNDGVATDADGRYSLSVAKGDVLVFSYIGYKTTEVKVDRNVIDIALQDDNLKLDDVVVVGYGSMKRSDLTGSVVSVTAEDMKKSINTSLDQALQGRAAGVNVTSNSGAPGGGISVSIRGVNSFEGNEPLYVVDGIPISGQSDKNSNTSALSSINPGDIISMEVLKDASATAIYGTRAANGVILITTRQGQAGKTRISYEGYYGIQELPGELEVLNLREYAVYQNLRAEVIGFGAREEFKDPSLLGNGTNWQKEIFRSAPMHSHQLSISGGNEKHQYAIMGGFMDQDGIGIGSNFERYSLRLNVNSEIRKWLKVGVNAYIARRKQRNTFDQGNIIETAVRQLPEVPVKNADGSWGVQEENMYGTYFSNPVADALARENYNKATDVQVRGFADFNIIKGLTLRVEGSTNINYYNAYQYTPLLKLGYFTQSSSSSRSSSNNMDNNLTAYLTYDRQFGKHHITAMAGHEARETEYESLNGSRTGFLFNNVHELGVGDAKTAKNGSGRSSSSIESWYGRFNYNFDNRYLLTATVRRDGSSSFSKNNRWATFPSLALAWRINQEKFLKDVTVINNLKLRLGWGIVGNQSVWQQYAYGTTMQSSATGMGQGYFPGNFSNPDLKWEKTKSYNAGIDLGLFGNRIEFIADVYKKDIDNLLMQAALPSYVSGVISSPWVNAGSMTNKGLELTLNTVNISNRDFQWTSGLTFSINRNKVTDLYTESSKLVGSVGGLAYTQTEIGQPVGQLYGYRVIGMFKDESDFYKKDRYGNNILDANGERIPVALPEGKGIGRNEVWVGDFMYYDKDGNGVINEGDREYIGNPEPKFTFGFSNNFYFKGFDLNIFLTGVYGNDIYNMLREKYTNPMSNSGLLKEATRIAVVGMKDPNGKIDDIKNAIILNPDASVQRINTTDGNTNNRISDRFVEDGSYLRIKNISLGYSLPKSLLSKWQIETLRLYVNIQNLHTFTNYSGYDPEVGSYDVLIRNIDYARYPSQRIYTFGLNLSF